MSYTTTMALTFLSTISAVVAACCALLSLNSAKKQRSYRRKLLQLELDMADLEAHQQLLQESHKKLRTREAVASYRTGKSSSPDSAGKGSTSTRSPDPEFPDRSKTSAIQMLNYNLRKNGLG
jgi:hypothetical protein